MLPQPESCIADTDSVPRIEQEAIKLPDGSCVPRDEEEARQMVTPLKL